MTLVVQKMTHSNKYRAVIVSAVYKGYYPYRFQRGKTLSTFMQCLFLQVQSLLLSAIPSNQTVTHGRSAWPLNRVSPKHNESMSVLKHFSLMCHRRKTLHKYSTESHSGWLLMWKLAVKGNCTHYTVITYTVGTPNVWEHEHYISILHFF